MARKFLQDISKRSARISFFLFFVLVSLSFTFFVMADDQVTNKNIFQDSDQDGLSNDEEALYKTDPLNKDTDGDGYMDGVEVESGYDPLRPAPGDKLITGPGVRDETETVVTQDTVTLTDQVSTQVADLVQSKIEDTSELTVDDINATVENIMNQADQEVVLPEISTDEIKIKKLSSKLKGTQRAEQEKEDAVEYLTVMAYILANNSPKKFSTENDLSSLLTSLGSQSLTAITLGNQKYLEDLAKMGKKILSETKDIAVPESMVELHMKALKLARYAMQLKDEVGKNGGSEDPMGTIASFAKIQGFFGAVAGFSQELYGMLSDLGIEEIPISL